MSLLNNISLSTKMVASMFFIILGMAIVSISSYIAFNKIGSEIEEIAEHQIPINSIITEIEKDILEEEVLTYRFIIACENVLSQEFKMIEKHILKLENETEHIIKKGKEIVSKAINHNTDEKTKNSYKLFLKELNLLEKEQLGYKNILIKLTNDVKKPDYYNLKSDTKKIEQPLSKMDKHIINLMKKMENLLIHSTKKTENDEHKALRTIEIISAIVLVFSIIVSYFLTNFFKTSIKQFQKGLLDFFKYINKEVKTVTLLNEKRSDEIGHMAKVVNKNILKIQDTIEKDKSVIENTVLVLSEFEKGDLSKRVELKTTNESLNELTRLLNNMATKLEENIQNILNILTEYSQDKYINNVKTEQLKEHFLKLATGINILGESINKSLLQGQKNANKLENSSTVLKDNMKNLSQSTLDAATSLEETAAALEEITRTMSSNTQNIQEMRKYATQVTSSAKKGEELATNTMKAMDEINEQTQSIAEAITIIDQIAFQTNILSLNAAVEAATAGEAGKGFAVVAQEVRNLATRSAQAAKEIKDLVENATIKADSGKNISANMLEEYKGLNEGISKTLDLIKNVDEASKEQQQGVEQINDAVAQLDRQTQQNSAIATEAKEIADDTSKIASTILEDINKKEFKAS